MIIRSNADLTSYNTFGIQVQANQLVSVESVSEVKQAIRQLGPPTLVLGGGSNVLLTQNIPGWVLHNQIKGITLENEMDDQIWISAGGGENWHSFVLHCLEKKWYGIENLSLIPGTVGAAPIQNIGAYGVELSQVFDQLRAVHLETGEERIFTKKECAFGYRDSVFKNQLKGQYLITHVVFKLRSTPQVNTSYGAILQVLSEWRIDRPTPKDISRAVISIRQSKLPDPAVLGNAGSFFKNPVIPMELFERLKKAHPSLPSYPVDTPERVKIPAGWLVEQSGWKGKRIGACGSHARQALVMVNYGGATGTEIVTLGETIQKAVLDQFGVALEREVQVV